MQTSGASRHFEELKDMTTQIAVTPCVIPPPGGSLVWPLFNVLSISCCPSSLTVLLLFSSKSPFTLFHAFHLSAAQSPTVTDPLQQAYAGVQHYAGDPTFLPSLLSPSVYFPLFAPFFGWSVQLAT